MEIFKEKEQFLFIIKITFIWGLAAHAFAFFNLLYNHDSAMVVTDDGRWQISLGRYMQPLYVKIRGAINAPWLIGIISLLFFSIAFTLICNLFSIDSKGGIIALCGIGITYISNTALISSYIHQVDNYAFAMLMAVLAFWMVCRIKYGIFLGAIALMISMGLYQSYFTCYIALAMLYAIYTIIQEKDIKKIVYDISRSVFCAGLGAALYKIGLELIMSATGIRLSTGYNSIANIGDFSDVSLIYLLRCTYATFVRSFVDSSYFFFVVIIAAVGIVEIAVYFKNNKVSRQIIGMFSIILLLLPFGFNFICFISKGYTSQLTTYADCFLYILPLCITCYYAKKSKQKLYYIGKNIIIGCCIIIACGGVVTSNQAYTKKKLVYDATESACTRMLCYMDMTEGYVSGVTPIIFLGRLEKNPRFRENYHGFDELNEVQALAPDTSITHAGTEKRWIAYALNTNLNVIYLNEYSSEIIDVAEDMPVFPERGCCMMVEDTMIVKLSDDY